MFLFVFRSFLTLIFLTFILTYALNSLISKLSPMVSHWPRWTLVVAIYFSVCLIAVGMGMIVFPKVYHEGKSLSEEIPEAKDKLLKSVRSILADPDFSRFIEGIGFEEALKQRVTTTMETITEFLTVLVRVSFHLLLSLIFSFLIIWDFDRLKTNVSSLKETRLGFILEILQPKVLGFADVVGRAFEAQIMVAGVNSILTFIGMVLLGVPSMMFLSMVVFVCSFIPVVGVFISSFPICILAYKKGAFALVFSSALMITLIHLIEAYVLNPRIVGAHFSIHPFVAVCILVISQSMFGIWGLLLGVPVAVFLFQSFLIPGINPEEPTNADNGAKNLSKALDI